MNEERQLYLASHLVTIDRLEELDRRLRWMNLAYNFVHGSATLPKHSVGKNPTSHNIPQTKTQGGNHLATHCEGQPLTVEDKPAVYDRKLDGDTYV